MGRGRERGVWLRMGRQDIGEEMESVATKGKVGFCSFICTVMVKWGSDQGGFSNRLNGEA